MILTLESSRRPQLARFGIGWTGSDGRDRRAADGLRGSHGGRAWQFRMRREPKRFESALGQAYRNNPTLNAQRAALRATDETVPQALSNYRPRVQGSFDSGYQHFESISTTGGGFTQTNTNISPRGGNIGLVQPLFNGQRSGNLTRQAEASVLAGRETLRNTEQATLLDAATSYMNVLRDTAILDLQRRNVQVLQEQLKQTRDRFNVGEVTRTDVAQSESRLAAAQSQVLSAEANLKTSQAIYRRVIGIEPVNLRPAMPVDRLSPAHAGRSGRCRLAASTPPSTRRSTPWTPRRWR